MFKIDVNPIDTNALREQVIDPAAGGFCAFEGWVRNHHQGRAVDKLIYEAYQPLAGKEGARILAEAMEKFSVHHAACIHRAGELQIGDMAVCVCVSSSHRDAAFEACRWIIDEVKSRVPIWKKEYFSDGESGWVRCDHA